VIFHINLFTLKPGLSDEQREAGLDLMRQDAANPTVRSWIVGRELGGEFETAPRTWSRTSTATGRT
jgi:Stress responsive A/B Barrel Domain